MLMEWVFMLLLIGKYEASIENETSAPNFLKGSNFDPCIEDFIKLLPQAIISKKLHISDGIKKDILDCVEREVGAQSLLGFVDLYGSSKSTEGSCDSFEGCTDEGGGYAETNKYSFLQCLDDHKRDLMECMVYSFLESIREFITMPNLEENLNGGQFDVNIFMCSVLQSCLPCVRKVSIEKCGKDGSGLFRKELEREHKETLDYCDEILIFKLKYSETLNT